RSSLLYLAIGPEVLLKPLDVAADLRQLFQGHEDALLFPLRRGRRTEHALAYRYFLGDPRLPSDDGPFSDSDMVDDTGLSGNDDVIAGTAGAGDAHLAHEQVVLADLAVMGDHHEIIDLGPLADARGLEGAAVNGCAGTDLDVGADLDIPQLGDLYVATAVKAVTETIRP